MILNIDTSYLDKFISPDDYDRIVPDVRTAHKKLHSRSGLGKNYLGWLDLPVNFDRDTMLDIQLTAQKIQISSDVFIVIGIGGSYLGAKAGIDFLKSGNYNFLTRDTPQIFFVGNTVSADAISEVLKICEGKDVSVNVISKSGFTLETSLAFRVFRKFLEEKYDKNELKSRIFVTTSEGDGILRSIARKEGYKSFVIPRDIGGRYSLFSPVGLLPLAVCGVDITECMRGAGEAWKDFSGEGIDDNACNKYAAVRNILYGKGKAVELIASYEPRLLGTFRWWQQLFGESEGKDCKGIFPSYAIFSADLHSLGQYIQEGRRMLFETILLFKKYGNDATLNFESEDADGLNFLAGKSFSHINKKIFEGTVLAHTKGGTPNIVLEFEEMSERTFGYMAYFFEKACAVSAYILGVNPFNQPGVEVYKKNVFSLLGLV